MGNINISFKLNTETGMPDTYLNGELVEREIRTLEVSNNVSPIATLAFVRAAMVCQQQAMGREKGIVMDGRDIGTGMPAEYNDILANVKERDYIDSHREVSPLRQAEDAVVLDNSHMTIPEQKEWLLAKFKETVEKDA